MSEEDNRRWEDEQLVAVFNAIPQQKKDWAIAQQRIISADEPMGQTTQLTWKRFDQVSPCEGETVILLNGVSDIPIVATLSNGEMRGSLKNLVALGSNAIWASFKVPQIAWLEKTLLLEMYTTTDEFPPIGETCFIEVEGNIMRACRKNKHVFSVDRNGYVDSYPTSSVITAGILQVEESGEE